MLGQTVIALPHTLLDQRNMNPTPQDNPPEYVLFRNNNCPNRFTLKNLQEKIHLYGRDYSLDHAIIYLSTGCLTTGHYMAALPDPSGGYLYDTCGKLDVKWLNSGNTMTQWTDAKIRGRITTDTNKDYTIVQFSYILYNLNPIVKNPIFGGNKKLRYVLGRYRKVYTKNGYGKTLFVTYQKKAVLLSDARLLEKQGTKNKLNV